MAFTSHGHYIMGSRKSGNPPKFKKRCYGDHRCETCGKDIGAYWDKHGADPVKEKGVEVVAMGDLTRERKARTLVENYIVDGLDNDKKGIKVEAYLLKLTRVGDAWKAILTSNIDNLIYEVVYLAKLKASRVTIFSPVDSVTIQDNVD